VVSSRMTVCLKRKKFRGFRGGWSPCKIEGRRGAPCFHLPFAERRQRTSQKRKKKTTDRMMKIARQASKEKIRWKKFESNADFPRVG